MARDGADHGTAAFEHQHLAAVLTWEVAPQAGEGQADPRLRRPQRKAGAADHPRPQAGNRVQVDLHRVGQNFDWLSGSSGGFLGQNDGACAGVEHHRYPGAVDLRCQRETARKSALYLDHAAGDGSTARREFGDTALGGPVQFEAIGIADRDKKGDEAPDESPLNCAR